MSDVHVIHAAFNYDTALCDRILAAAKQNRDQMQLFLDIARYTSKLMPSNNNPSDVPSQSKKRRLENDEAPRTAQHDVKETTAFLKGDYQNVYKVPDTSFTLPQRKKMNLSLHVDIQDPSNAYLAIEHPASNIHYAIPLTSITQAFCLPVPEKAQRQWNFIVFANLAIDLITNTPLPEESVSQILWTMPEAAPLTATFSSPAYAPIDGDTYVTSCLRSLNTLLKPLSKPVILPSDKEFISAIPQAHRKGEPAYHIKAHRGAKDGYLFLTSVGIIWAFKKPLAFFAFADIEAVAYTSVLQRTFNIVITTMGEGTTTGKAEEVEFSMLDQADFAGIDAWIKGHGLNDASMAAERRAKKVNVNGKAKTAETKGGDQGDNDGEGERVVAEDEETELEKAQREIEDAEDEEEEDYDPGSEGESEGEGGSSEEEEEDGDGGGDDEEVEEEEDGEEGEGNEDEE